MNNKSRIVRLETQLVAQEKALSVASQGLNERLHSMNEWRQASMDRDNTFLLKDVYDTQHQNLGDKVNKNTDDITKLLTTKTSWTQAWMIIAGIIAAGSSITTVLVLIFRHAP